MDRHPRSLVACVLAAFVATTAVPGARVIAHRHGGADHDHVHAVLEADHDRLDRHRHHDDHHHQDHDHHGDADHDERRDARGDGPALADADRDPLRHVHYAPLFQPATCATSIAIGSARAVARSASDAPVAPPARGPDVIRARGPPPVPFV